MPAISNQGDTRDLPTVAGGPDFVFEGRVILLFFILIPQARERNPCVRARRGTAYRGSFAALRMTSKVVRRLPIVGGQLAGATLAA
jgi:hypothetical protein